MGTPKKMRLIRDLETPSVSIKAGSVFEYCEHSDAYYFPVKDGNYGHDRDKVIGNNKWFEPVEDLTHEEILGLPIWGFAYDEGDDLPTIKEYLKEELILLFRDEERGNYEYTKAEIYGAFAKNKIILKMDGEGSYEEVNKGDFKKADQLINKLIERIWT